MKDFLFSGVYILLLCLSLFAYIKGEQRGEDKVARRVFINCFETTGDVGTCVKYKAILLAPDVSRFYRD